MFLHLNKTIFFIALNLLWFATFGQNVTYKKDTIYNDVTPYCLMKSSGSFAKNFKVYTFTGKEFLRVIYDNNTKEYTATFLPDLEQCIYNFQSLKLGKELAESIIDAQLIKADTLDKKSIAFFIKLYGRPIEVVKNEKQGLNLSRISASLENFANDLNDALSSNEPKLLERNRSAMIFVHGDEISQDHITIGHCESSMKAVPGGISYTYTFYDHNKNLVANATVLGSDATINIRRQNRQFTLRVKDSNKLNVEKELAEWLVENYYL
jgi:hypothetical protein